MRLAQDLYAAHITVCASCTAGIEVTAPFCDEGEILGREAHAEVTGIPVASHFGKRFFRLHDNGVDWSFVAVDFADAQRVFREAIVLGTISLVEPGSADFEERPSWEEIPIERAIACNTFEDGGKVYEAPLAQRNLGDFYCSEW